MAKPSKPLAQATARTEVRNSPIPKIAARPATSRVVTQEQIAKRAYEIHASGQGGSELDNWLRAERELRGV